MRIKHDPRFPAEIRDSALGELSVTPLPISYTPISLVPISITAITTGSYASVSDVQLLANAIAEIGKLCTT